MPARNRATGPPMTFALTLPLPPGVNNQYVTVGRRRVLSKPALAFKKDVARTIERARQAGAVPADVDKVLAKALMGVYLTFFFETPMRRDLDCGLKIALDAVCGEFGLDDRAVVDLHLTKRIDPLRPRLEMEIEEIRDWSFDRTYVYLGDDDEEAEPDAAAQVE